MASKHGGTPFELGWVTFRSRIFRKLQFYPAVPDDTAQISEEPFGDSDFQVKVKNDP
jgi:hypothetical protein